MDYVTRQYINLTKKLRKELPKLAALIHRDFKQHTEAIHAAKKSSEDQRDIQPVWLEPILTKYQEPIRDKKASDNRQYGVQNSIRWATWSAFAAALIYGAIAGVQLWDFNKSIGISQIIAKHARVQAAAAIKSAQATKEAADVARESLESVQRAFVIFEPLPQVHPRLSNGTVAAFQFQFKLENVGNTPTNDMAFHLNTWRDFVPITKYFPFDDLDATGKKCISETQNGCQHLRVVLGPKGYTTSGLFEVDAAFAQAVNQHVGHVYFYGTTTYRDIFPNTRTHRTEMCEEMVFVDTANNTFATTDCPYHNCTDDECDEEDRQRQKRK